MTKVSRCDDFLVADGGDGPSQRSVGQYVSFDGSVGTVEQAITQDILPTSCYRSFSQLIWLVLYLVDHLLLWSRILAPAI
jgi:hypothetical protein